MILFNSNRPKENKMNESYDIKLNEQNKDMLLAPHGIHEKRHYSTRMASLRTQDILFG